MIDPLKFNCKTESRLTLVEKEACITLSVMYFELEGNINISCLVSDQELVEELERKFKLEEGRCRRAKYYRPGQQTTGKLLIDIVVFYRNLKLANSYMG